MKDPVASLQPTRRSASASEDQALNALCDARLKERRYPLQKLLDKLGHELER